MDLLFELFNILLVVPMTNVLVALARLCGGNFGAAIIIFTLVMKFITWPLTSSQYKASRAMQAIQPQLQELQKKYKGKDPKKLQQETMALYREAGVNPLGCLFPLLAQFPIWIALYQVVSRSLGDTPEGFVTLSTQLYPIDYVQSAVPFNTNLLFWHLGKSDNTYLLPILVGLTMYIQQKMITPTPTVAPTTPQQMQQQQTQQMMAWMLPFMFAFWSLNVPAGLALYWFVSNLSGIVLQYFYLGRKVDWRGMLRLGPPAPAPAVRGAQSSGKAIKPAAPERELITDDDGADDAPAEPAGRVAAPGQGARKRRHGRRRGKR